MGPRRRFYIRSVPQHYHDARTPEQLRNREKLKMLMEFLSAAKGFVNKHLERWATGQTATNVATALNFGRAFGTSGGLNYGDVTLSQGRRAELDGLTVLRDGSGVVLGWQRGVAEEGSMDEVSVMVYNAVRKERTMVLGGGRRRDEGMRVEVPSWWTGEEWHVYVAVKDELSGETSRSQYWCVGTTERTMMTDGATTAMAAAETDDEREAVAIFFGPEKEQSAIKEVSDTGES